MHGVHPILRIATQAVRSAGRELMARAPQAPSSRAISAASETYFQRTHDRAMRAISHSIDRFYPEHSVIEAHEFKNDQHYETQWVIEPINGQLNFMRRLDHFCTLVAIFRNNRLHHGLIVDHFRDGHFHVTLKEGCYTSDGRMRVSDTRSTQHALIAQNADGKITDDPNAGFITRVTGSLGLDLANTARGRYDAIAHDHTSAFHFQFVRLFIREAGGFATTLRGGEWKRESDGIIAGNTYIQRRLVATRLKSAKIPIA